MNGPNDDSPMTESTSRVDPEAVPGGPALRRARPVGGDAAGLVSNLPVILFQRARRGDGRVHYTYVSPNAAVVLGSEAAPGSEADFVFRSIHPEDREALSAAVDESARTMQPMREEFRIVLADGQVRWLGGASSPRDGGKGRILWDGFLLDITEQRREAERLSYLAFHDPLTGLLNRVGFGERFDAIRRDLMRPGDMAAVMTVGLDRFDLINSTLGHGTGDAVLRAVATRIAGAAGAEQTVARLSGNTFSLLIAPCGDRQSVVLAVEEMLRVFDRPLAQDERYIDINASVGISLFPIDGEDAETLLKNAGTALRRAQQADPGGYRFFREDMNDRARQVMILEGRLNQALRHHEFTAYYQPQMDIASGRIVGVEALVRWTDPRLGIVPPEAFIGIAEDIGLIASIGEHVLRLACERAEAWRQAGLGPLSLAVNISPRQFGQPRKLQATIERALADTGLDPALLELEVTESSLMDAPDEALQAMHRLNLLGVSLAVDDFGAGHSSLVRLRDLPIAKLKIDRAFVRDVARDADAAAIARAMIILGHALRLTVVAEGVEDNEQLAFLKRESCDVAQGSLISAPLSAEAMEQFLRQRQS